MKTLVVVESPGKVKKLASILGDDYKVAASIGHVRDLPEDVIGVQPPDFKPVYEATTRGKKVLAGLRGQLASFDRVLLATDPDREGEAIAWHLAEALRLQHVQRITFTEITPSAVLAAIQRPRNIDMPVVRAQEARRVLDRLVGYKVGPALSNRAGQRLTAGRVQSPAVRLVVDRERAICSFRATEHYGALLTLGDGQGGAEWTAAWQVKPHFAEGQEYMLDDSLAARVAVVRVVTVASFEDSEAAKAPPAPFTTSTMQRVAGARLAFKPKQTMELAQTLYEQGHISYHRTDSPNMSEDAVRDIAAFAAKAGLQVAAKRRTWKAKEGAQEGHEAIRPTHMEQRAAGDTDDQRALYQLIWTRALASQLADARYAVRSAVLEGNAGDVPVSFLARGRTLTDKGWLAVMDDEPAEEGQEPDGDASNPVPVLALGQALNPLAGQILTKITRPPPRFKLNTLVAELENRGIGRPSTYAAILDNITARGYIIEGVKDFLTPSPAGEAIRDALVGTFRFADLDYTRELEEQLDAIASSAMAYPQVVGQAYEQLERELATLGTATVRVSDADAITCPVCKEGQLRRRKGTNGFFWGCTRWQEGCKTTFEDSRGKPALGGKEATSCPVCCQGVLRQRSSSNGKFWGCSRYPDCKTNFPDKRGRPDLAAKKLKA